MPLNLNHFFCAQKSPFSRAKITQFDAHLLYDMAGPPARKRTRGGASGSNRGPASRTWGGYAQKGRGTGGSTRGPAATTRAPPASHCDIFTEASGTEETDKKSCSKMSENSFRFSRCLLKEIDAQNFGARTMFFRSSRARPLQARSLGAPIPGLRVLSKM